MASITTEKNGRVRIGFRLEGKHKTLRLGAVDRATAEEYRKNISHMVACGDNRQLFGERILRWIELLDPRIHDRMTAVGILPPRPDAPVQPHKLTLGVFLDEYFAALNVKDSTLKSYANAKRHLLTYFGADKDLASITAKDGDQFFAWLRKVQAEYGEKPLASATVSRRMNCTRDIFNKAKRWYKLDNPFADIKTPKQTNAKNSFYVSQECIQGVLDACPDAEWRCIITLSRWGGLRCPSEHLAIRWTDVNWVKGSVLVHSAKTEHHEGGDTRVVPLFPELRLALEELLAVNGEGAGWVIERYRSAKQNLRSQFLRILRRAQVKPWPRLFQNLRASRETELMKKYPMETACAWIGNSPKVALAHYFNDPEKDAYFADAVKSNPTQKATRPEEQSEVIGGNQEMETLQKHRKNKRFANSVLGNTGLEPLQDSRDSRAFSQGDAKSDALAEVVATWGGLSTDTKQKILTLLRKDTHDGKTIHNRDG